MTTTSVDYGSLLRQALPKVVRDEKQNADYVRRLELLTSKKRVTRAERELIELLTLLVEEFESRQFPVREAGPLDIIRHLMEANGLRQKDLLDVFGTESIVSDVLNGKRELTKEHIRKLSKRFHVSPAVFF